MAWIICAVVGILLLAYAIRRATRGTPFQNCLGCTPNIDHLRKQENKGADNED